MSGGEKHTVELQIGGLCVDWVGLRLAARVRVTFHGCPSHPQSKRLKASMLGCGDEIKVTADGKLLCVVEAGTLRARLRKRAAEVAVRVREATCAHPPITLYSGDTLNLYIPVADEPLPA